MTHFLAAASGARRLGLGTMMCIGVLTMTSVTAGASAQGHKVSKKEGDFAAAGFVVRPANTPEREAMLSRLPEKKIVQRNRNGVVHYVYADAKGCNCLYVGDQKAFQVYNQRRQQKDTLNQIQLSNEEFSDPAWNWGAWGGGFGPGFGYDGLGW